MSSSKGDDGRRRIFRNPVRNSISRIESVRDVVSERLVGQNVTFRGDDVVVEIISADGTVERTVRPATSADRMAGWIMLLVWVLLLLGILAINCFILYLCYKLFEYNPLFGFSAALLCCCFCCSSSGSQTPPIMAEQINEEAVQYGAMVDEENPAQ
jgi:hypothetical protein